MPLEQSYVSQDGFEEIVVRIGERHVHFAVRVEEAGAVPDQEALHLPRLRKVFRSRQGAYLLLCDGAAFFSKGLVLCQLPEAHECGSGDGGGRSVALDAPVGLSAGSRTVPRT